MIQIAIILAALFSLPSWGDKPIVIGSKKFTESVILAEILSQKLQAENISTRQQKELGGTRIIWSALLAGNIDAYVEYSGTLFSELLPKVTPNSFSELKQKLHELGIGISKPLGFNNTYGLGMNAKKASALKITKISDLKKFSNFKLGISPEFMNRADGWPGVQKKYSLANQTVRAMDHSISYRALESGNIDLVDVYTTDGEIKIFNITVLEDDLNFFPRYDAVILYRLDAKNRAPQLASVIASLEGAIDQDTMTIMNAAVTIGRKKEPQVAADYLNKSFGLHSDLKIDTRISRIYKLTKEHLNLVGVSLLLALFFGIPLGILASKYKHFGTITLQIVGIIQTIPALALLVILIRPLNTIGLRGIGETPAIVALFLYSLLPIVVNTHAGFTQLSHDIKESMHSLAMTTLQRVRYIELPLALPTMLAGIKTAAVINIGFATLGALVGAGGFGQPILTGIRLDDYSLILEGAIPAALLAILVERLFLLSEKILLPKPLRRSASN